MPTLGNTSNLTPASTATVTFGMIVTSLTITYGVPIAYHVVDCVICPPTK